MPRLTVLVGDRGRTGDTDRRFPDLGGGEPVGVAARAAAVDDRTEKEVVARRCPPSSVVRASRIISWAAPCILT